MIAGFLLLNIHTVSTTRLREHTFIDYLKWATTLLFIVVTILFIINFEYTFWLFIVAICCQIFVALIEMIRR